MEEEDDDFYDPADAVPLGQDGQAGAGQNDAVEAASKDENGVEEELEAEEDDVSLWKKIVHCAGSN